MKTVSFDNFDEFKRWMLDNGQVNPTNGFWRYESNAYEKDVSKLLFSVGDRTCFVTYDGGGRGAGRATRIDVRMYLVEKNAKNDHAAVCSDLGRIGRDDTSERSEGSGDELLEWLMGDVA